MWFYYIITSDRKFISVDNRGFIGLYDRPLLFISSSEADNFIDANRDQIGNYSLSVKRFKLPK